jgi:hypothetical protein
VLYHCSIHLVFTPFIDKLFCCARYDSLHFLVWRESDKSLTLLAKDYEPCEVFAAGIISRGGKVFYLSYHISQSRDILHCSFFDNPSKAPCHSCATMIVRICSFFNMHPVTPLREGATNLFAELISIWGHRLHRSRVTVSFVIYFIYFAWL